MWESQLSRSSTCRMPRAPTTSSITPACQMPAPALAPTLSYTHASTGSKPFKLSCHFLNLYLALGRQHASTWWSSISQRHWFLLKEMLPMLHHLLTCCQIITVGCACHACLSEESKYLQIPVSLCSLYLECADGAGILEWNTANDTLVKLHNIVGVVTGAPADDVIFVGNNEESSATLLKPGGAFSVL